MGAQGSAEMAAAIEGMRECVASLSGPLRECVLEFDGGQQDGMGSRLARRFSSEDAEMGAHHGAHRLSSEGVATAAPSAAASAAPSAAASAAASRTLSSELPSPNAADSGAADAAADAAAGAAGGAAGAVPRGLSPGFHTGFLPRAAGGLAIEPPPSSKSPTPAAAPPAGAHAGAHTTRRLPSDDVLLPLGSSAGGSEISISAGLACTPLASRTTSCDAHHDAPPPALPVVAASSPSDTPLLSVASAASRISSDGNPWHSMPINALPPQL